METVLELAPLVAFFAAFKLGGIYWATGTLMVGAPLLALVHRLRTGRFKDLHVVTAALVLVLGTATLVLHDKRFIQWKPSVLFALLAGALLVSTFVGERPLIQRLFQAAMPDALLVKARAWRILNVIWAVWFLGLALANLYIARHYSEEFWVHFHTYGITLANLIFLVPQAIWLGSRAVPAGVAAGAEGPR